MDGTARVSRDFALFTGHKGSVIVRAMCDNETLLRAWVTAKDKPLLFR